MSLERGNEDLGVEQWRMRRNPKEEEEGVFITPSRASRWGLPAAWTGHSARVAESPASLQNRPGSP
jgi:hypothetical protein